MESEVYSCLESMFDEDEELGLGAPQVPPTSWDKRRRDSTATDKTEPPDADAESKREDEGSGGGGSSEGREKVGGIRHLRREWGGGGILRKVNQTTFSSSPCLCLSYVG